MGQIHFCSLNIRSTAGNEYNGWIYGTLTEVSHPGAQDIYTITDEKGSKWQLPAVPEFVKERVPEEGYVLVTPIPGMFGEAESGDAE